MLEVALELWSRRPIGGKKMSDAVRIEQRLHDLEQRLHDALASWWHRPGKDHAGDGQSPREMEQQAVERLFADRHRYRAPAYAHDVKAARAMEQQAVERLFAHRHQNQAPAYAHDVKAAREMERQAIKRLYGGRSTVVVEAKHKAGNEDS
jgi:hypothetical protein